MIITYQEKTYKYNKMMQRFGGKRCSNIAIAQKMIAIWSMENLYRVHETEADEASLRRNKTKWRIVEG